jgi:hypothetical protein
MMPVNIHRESGGFNIVKDIPLCLLNKDANSVFERTGKV